MSSSDALRRKLLKTPNAPGRPPIPVPRFGSASTHSESKGSDYSPLGWNKYFSEKKYVPIKDDIFCVYKCSTKNSNLESAAIILLHGGGFSGLTWARFAALLFEDYDCEIYALDLRGHGETTTQDEYDLSVETLSRDIASLIVELELNHRRVVLMGHSMGGALAVHSALHLQSEKPVDAIIVVDVVEGSAMDSLNTMPSFLKNRPNGFETISSAIQWSVKTGHIKELESARVSMPGQLKCSATKMPATTGLDCLREEKKPEKVAPTLISANSISEEDEEDSDTTGDVSDLTDPIESADSLQNEESKGTSAQTTEESRLDLANSSNTSTNAVCSSSSPENTQKKEFTSPSDLLSSSQDFRWPNKGEKYPYIWRIDLMKTEHNWRRWFDGLSKKFLSVPCPKLLLLAGTDRMDKELMVGHMQGKFEVQFMSNVGHAIQEDSPDGAVNHVSKFLTRHKLITAKSTS